MRAAVTRVRPCTRNRLPGAGIGAHRRTVRGARIQPWPPKRNVTQLQFFFRSAHFSYDSEDPQASGAASNRLRRLRTRRQPAGDAAPLCCTLELCWTRPSLLIRKLQWPIVLRNLTSKVRQLPYFTIISGKPFWSNLLTIYLFLLCLVSGKINPLL